jgi:hypothetical protein
MHLLDLLIILVFLHKETRKHIACVVEACTPGLADSDEALLLLVLPDSGGVVLRARNECAVERVHIQESD